METFYLVDFENVHNGGLENIESLSKTDHVHIFSTEKAANIRMNIVFAKGIDIEGHIVPVRSQSVDMHLVSYLGHLLGIHGKQSAYVIVSKDKDYDNIIKFWNEKGYLNISRQQKIETTAENQKKAGKVSETIVTQTTNSKISQGMDHNFSGKERTELNSFMQRGLAAEGYSPEDVGIICSYVVEHCNDDRILRGIHNDLRNQYGDYLTVYEDVKRILEKFADSKGKDAKREAQIRFFFEQHFKKKTYTDHKEEIIKIILNAKTRQQVNNELMKLYADGNAVKHILQTIKPFIKELPGK
ncbi:MAG: PIN domain-containing protein [Bacteroidales bacterium]|nr:PIN domain-containing protein [Bacteroidales bacterium]MCM1415671.1 PIN domain-containing protein [bacterium]MCM1423917.1 PIN domain-containing protein [bacterium]